MSSRVTRPPEPVPESWRRSTLCSAASLRTSGDEGTRSPDGGATGSGGSRRGFRGHRRRRRWRYSSGCGAITTDDGDNVIDLDGFARLGLDVGEYAAGRSGDFGIHFVGGDFKERLVAGDLVADLLEPLGDGALKDGFAHLGHDNFDGRAGGRGAGRLCLGLRLNGGRRRELCRGRREGGALGGEGRSGNGGAGFVDDADNGVDLDGLALLVADLLEDSSGGGGDFGVDLVGGDLEERLVALDSVAGLLEPLGDGAFEDGFAHLGHEYIGRHGVPSARKF